MQNTAQQEKHQKRLRTFTRALESGTLASVRKMLNALHPAEIAHLLESLPPQERELLWEMVDEKIGGDVLLYVNDELRASLIEDMEPEELVAAAEGLETDDLADFLHDLPDVVIQEVLQSMDEQDRQRLESVLSYPEDTAGGLMNTDTITVRPDVTLDVVLRYLRLRGELPPVTDKLFVVDRDDHYLGSLPLTTLLTQAPTLSVSEVMTTEVESIPATMSARDVASLFEHHDLVSAPVVDDEGRLVGRITIDDVVDVIRDEGEHSLLSMTGLDEEEDMFAPVPVSARHRGVWLGINLLTAFIASWVIGLFQETIDKVVALAVLMPIVASMGGIAGSQTLTLVIRGIAVGKIGDSNARKLLLKELAVGLLNGVWWALVVAAITVLWFGDYRIGMVIAIAIVVNLVFAALAGATIPMLLRKLGADPALGGSVLLTTVTDVVGFMAFLGLATVILL
ncbi:MAG TPA: magnesium transporter [Gammaproteobacteria bacterium]|nr:magnesium transporter [Gammaproteobacteria bacterium]